MAFGNEIIRMIFGPAKEGIIWRIKYNREIRNLFTPSDIVPKMKSRRLRWIDHDIRKTEDVTIKQIWKKTIIRISYVHVEEIRNM